jgi:adenylate cyclase
MSAADSSEPDQTDGADQFARQVSHVRHDIRSPLTNIIGFADILIEDAGEEDQNQFLPDYRRIRQLAGDIFERVNSVLDLAGIRADPGSLKELQSFILETAPAIKATIRQLLDQPSIAKHESCADDLRRIAAGTAQLAERARDMLDELTILAGDSREEEQGGENSRLTGAEDLTKTSFITRQFLEGETGRQPDRPERRLRGAVILVVDDNESNRILLSRRLGSHSYEVDTAADGLAAMEKIRDRQYDCVLLDVIMPGLNGYEVLEQIKTDDALRHLPVIMISAMDDIDSLVRCIEHGADDYLAKPFDPVLLGARVNACLEKKHLRDQEQSLLHRLQGEQIKVEKLLLNILPERIADRLKQGENTIVDQFPEATVMFIDLVGFSPLFDRYQPAEIVHVLNRVFSALDKLSEQHGLEKIKTIGDAYLVAGGIPSPRPDHAAAIADMALDVKTEIARISAANEFEIQFRIGIDTGPVVAGIIGEKKFIYDLWGNTVNAASRMESHGEPGRIQITDRVFAALPAGYTFDAPRTLDVKGLGQMPTRFLTGKSAT